MGAIAPQITSLTIVYSIVYSDADQRKRQTSASLAFVRGIHREPVNSPHKWPVTRKMFPFDDVIMISYDTAYSIELNKVEHSHILNSLKTRHNSPPGTSYGLPSVSILEKSKLVITTWEASYCQIRWLRGTISQRAHDTMTTSLLRENVVVLT